MVLIVLLLCSAFFSGSETALFSLSKIRVKRLQIENAKNSKALAYLLNRPRNLIVTILIGNMLVNVLASAYCSSVCLRLFGNKGIGISIGVMTFLILTIGEITPKIIAICNSEKISLALTPYINFFFNLFSPVRKFLLFIVNIITSIFQKKTKEKKRPITQEELNEALEFGRREGVLNLKEEEMIKGVFKFGDKKAKDVFVKLQKIVAVDISTPLETIRSIITKKELSRLPVFEDHLSNIIGILYAKDLVIAHKKGPFILRNILRKPFYVNEDIKLDELLRKFRTERIHMALVLNNKEKLTGLVTLHDLLEELIGEIRDIKASV